MFFKRIPIGDIKIVKKFAFLPKGTQYGIVWLESYIAFYERTFSGGYEESNREFWQSRGQLLSKNDLDHFLANPLTVNCSGWAICKSDRKITYKNLTLEDKESLGVVDED